MANSEAPEYANLSADIAVAMMTNTLEYYNQISLYKSLDINNVSAMCKEFMYSYKSLEIN